MGRLLAAIVLVLIVAAPAAAQDERSVLLILDSSKSMNDPSASGGTRLDAAKAATKALLEEVPPDARVGLRVYGSKVSEAGRAAGCRDTELVIPVGAVDREQVAQVVDGLEGKGRTPIGRSILAAPEDFTTTGGRRTVILVSDGGDNCAPPDPCRAAQEVSRQGIDMTIQVVGLQVSDRIRRQLQCIADAGGGTYVDATDESLRAELAAIFARAFRPYEPTGKPIEGGPAPDAAVTAEPGQYLDSLQPGQARWYSVDVKKGQRLFAAATLIYDPPPRPEISWLVDATLQDPQGEALFEDTEIFRTRGGRNPVGTFAASLEHPAPADGTYRFGVAVQAEHAIGQESVPVEVTFGLSGGEADEPRPRADDAKTTAPREKASDTPALAGIGGAGAILGALIGFLAMRARRP